MIIYIYVLCKKIGSCTSKKMYIIHRVSLIHSGILSFYYSPLLRNTVNFHLREIMQTTSRVGVLAAVLALSLDIFKRAVYVSTLIISYNNNTVIIVLRDKNNSRRRSYIIVIQYISKYGTPTEPHYCSFSHYRNER